MNSRKTFEVKALKEFCNKMLSRPENDFAKTTTQEWKDGYRYGIATALEHVLHETHNYRGFNYVEWAEENGFEKWQAAGKPVDNTPYLGNQHRKVYYQVIRQQQAHVIESDHYP